MSLSLLKSLRDGTLAGVVSVVSYNYLVNGGLDPLSSTVASAALAALTMRVYRYARSRDNAVGHFLQGIDPAAEENKGQ